MLLMLEDNPERVQRFCASLHRIDPAMKLRVWRNAWTMIRQLEEFLPLAQLISLDHDLDPEEGDNSDPGCGLDLTKVLAHLSPVCPVVIHSSNGERATWMCGEFDLGGWDWRCVAPLGDDWIEQHWLRTVRSLLRRRSAS